MAVWRATRSSTCGSSQWFCAYPVFAETRAYRRYHLQHHAHTQQDDDPDLVLSAPFPITPRELPAEIPARYHRPDRLSAAQGAVPECARTAGVAACRARSALLVEKLGPQFVANAVLFAALAVAGVWWAYPLLWILPFLTWQMVITRIRNIAEHAVVPDSNDPLRNTRTTRANFLERLFVAPYYVNYHLEHHLLYYVPCYNLPRVHDILVNGPHAARMEVQPGYAAVLRLAMSKPNSEDRPGELTSNARRAQAGPRWKPIRRRPASNR